jgi:hypothetical protein
VYDGRVTRWCAYAVLAIAMVCSSIAKSDPMPQLRSGLYESSARPSSTARKRSGKPAQVAREANGTSPALVPDLIACAPIVRVWIDEAGEVGVRRYVARGVVACSRAPPRTRLSFH